MFLKSYLSTEYGIKLSEIYKNLAVSPKIHYGRTIAECIVENILRLILV